jgi:hypothetical protein
MRKHTYDGLAALTALRAKLDTTSTLEVINEGGNCWKAHFTFNSPAEMKALEDIKRYLMVPFPTAYQDFLLQYNGALLYYESIYGQWGFQIYGTDTLLKANENCIKRYGEEWPSVYLAFAESRGDADILVLDTAHFINEKDCRVIDGNSDDLPNEWTPAARSFGDWLDRLVVAQGAKYWRWY